MKKKSPNYEVNMGEDYQRFEQFQYLKQIDIIQVAVDELQKIVVGEKETLQTLFLISQGGRLVINAEPTSSNLAVNDSSGAGKDFVVKQVMKLVPEKLAVIRKRISEKVFTYWHNAKFEPSWTWDGKVFYNEDISGGVLNGDVFKVMCSSDGENQSTIIVNQNPIEILIRGKPVIIVTFAVTNPKQELLRRFPFLMLDTSEEQTRQILLRKAQNAIKGNKQEYDLKIVNCLSLLKRVRVKIPFADKLVNVLSTKNIIIRTHFDRLLDYIKFSSALYQFTREKDENDYIIANEKDYETARVAMIKTTSNVFAIPITKNQRRILEVFQSLDSKYSYSISDLEPRVTFISDRMLRKELDVLTEHGFLSKDKADREGSKKPVMVYSYVGDFKISIPTWRDIQNSSNVSFNSIDTNNSNVSSDEQMKQMKQMHSKCEDKNYQNLEQIDMTD